MRRAYKTLALALTVMVWFGWLATKPAFGEIRFGGNVAGLYTYDFEDLADLGGRPGTALAVIRDADLGITFGEKLVGQSNTATDQFDFVSGSPNLPVAVEQNGDPAYGLHVMSVFGTTVLNGLGLLGFPHRDAIGEGAVTVLFDKDQRLIAFDVVGANPGPLYIEFFDRRGNSLGNVVVFEPPNDTFVYGSDNKDIAAVVFNNHDFGGLGFDNFLFVPGTNDGDAVCSVDGPYEYDDENQVVIVPLSAGFAEPPGDDWTFQWTTDCQGAAIADDRAAVTTMEVAAPDGCSVDCSVTLIVDKGYEKDICSSDVIIQGETGASVECPADIVVESDGSGNLDDLHEWLGQAESTDENVYNDFDGMVYECNNTGSVTTTWWIEGGGASGCGGESECTSTFTVVDTTAPELTVDTSPIVVEDLDCDGGESVTLPDAWASDVGDGEVTLTTDAPEVFPTGTTTVTYTVTDECGNTATAEVEVTVVAGAGVDVLVRSRNKSRGADPLPIPNTTVGAYDVTPQGCAAEYARNQRGMSVGSARAIFENCEPSGAASTDGEGLATVGMPAGRYVIIAAVDLDGDGQADTYLSQPTGYIQCTKWKDRRLELLMDAP